jgi:hypothetical protein
MSWIYIRFAMKTSTATKMKAIILACSLFLLPLTCLQGQVLESDMGTISIDTFETQELTFLGKKQVVHTGILLVTHENKTTAYRFYFPELDGKPSHLTIRDAENNVLEPRLYYNQADTSFSFFRGTGKEGKEKAVGGNDNKELVLSGMLIWLRRKE